MELYNPEESGQAADREAEKRGSRKTLEMRPLSACKVSAFVSLFTVRRAQDRTVRKLYDLVRTFQCNGVVVQAWVEDLLCKL